MLLLLGNPPLKNSPPVVHPAADAEERRERAARPALFLASARNAELDLNVERREYVHSCLGHLGPLSGLRRPLPIGDFLRSPFLGAQSPKHIAVHGRPFSSRNSRTGAWQGHTLALLGALVVEKGYFVRSPGSRRRAAARLPRQGYRCVRQGPSSPSISASILFSHACITGSKLSPRSSA